MRKSLCLAFSFSDKLWSHLFHIFLAVCLLTDHFKSIIYAVSQIPVITSLWRENGSSNLWFYSMTFSQSKIISISSLEKRTESSNFLDYPSVTENLQQGSTSQSSFPPSSTKLGTKPLIHGPFRNISDPTVTFYPDPQASNLTLNAKYL